MALSGYLRRLTWGGSLFTLDSWSVGLYMHSESPIADGKIDDLVGPITDWFSHLDSLIPLGAHLDFVKFNLVNPLTGKYALQSSNTRIVASLPGTVGNSQAPQVALALSLRTAFSRGRGHTGRLYAPVGGTSLVGSDGRATVNAAGAAGTTFKVLVNQLNLQVAGNVVVFSKLAQTVTPVTGVQVGRVLDTQRRRRSSLVETPVLQTLA